MKKMQSCYNVLRIWAQSNPKKVCVKLPKTNSIDISNCGQQNPSGRHVHPCPLCLLLIIAFDLKNATHDQHPEGVIFSRCSPVPCPKVFHLACWQNQNRTKGWTWSWCGKGFQKYLPLIKHHFFSSFKRVKSFLSTVNSVFLRAWEKGGAARLRQCSCGDRCESANHILSLVYTSCGVTVRVTSLYLLFFFAKFVCVL